MVGVAADVGVQQADGERARVHLTQTRYQVVVHVPGRIADAVNQGAFRFTREQRNRLEISAKPMATIRIGQSRLPAIQRVVVSVAHKRPDAGGVQAAQAVDEGTLGAQAPVRAVIYIPGHEQSVHLLSDAEVYDGSV